MKRIYFILALAISMVILIFKPCLAQDINYKLTQYTIDADIQRDGSVYVTEYLNYSFKGSANGVIRNIDYINPKDSLHSAQSLESLTVYEANLIDDDLYEYIRGDGKNGSKGVYSLTNTENGINLKIYSPAKNEDKRFVIQYHLKNVVVRYKDTSDFHWNFIGNGWSSDMDNVSIVVTIPEDSNKLRVFSHGPYSGNTKLVDTKTVEYDINHLDASKSVSLRLLFPGNIISESHKYINENMLSSILRSEEKLAKEANAERRNTLISISLAAAWPIISIILLIWMHNTYGRRKPVNSDAVKTPPGDYGPALVEYILNFNGISPRGLTAEIMSLIKKKILMLEKLQWDSSSKKDNDEYRIIKSCSSPCFSYRHEEFLVNWLIGEIGDGKSVSFNEISTYSNKSPDKFNSKFLEYKNIIRDEAIELGFKKETTSAYKIGLCFLCSSLAIALAIGIPYGMYVFIASASFNALLVLLISLFIKKPTQELSAEREKWTSYKKYIKDISQKPLEESYTLPFWEEALLYAIIFGYYEVAIKQIKSFYPSDSFGDASLTYLYAGESGTSGIDSFSNIITDAITNFSSTTGFDGGGSSGGDGSGGGGGGGGAF